MLYMILNREHDLGVKLKHKKISVFFSKGFRLVSDPMHPINMNFLK